MPSPAEELARLFYKEVHDDDEADPLSGNFSFSCRVPIDLVIKIDCLAAHSELSRNAMANELLRVGISSLFAALPDPIRDEINESIVTTNPADYL
jgi:hypothetical protein